MERVLISLSEAARRMNVCRKTVADLVRVHKIETYRIPVSGRAKGLDKRGVRRLKKLLTPTAISA